jgi:Bacterial membrane protein N terminal.
MKMILGAKKMGPPDLDDAIKAFKKKMFSSGGGGDKKSNFLILFSSFFHI